MKMGPQEEVKVEDTKALVNVEEDLVVTSTFYIIKHLEGKGVWI